MKKRILCFGLIVAVVVGLFFAIPASMKLIGFLRGEPFFQGWPASHWRDALNDPSRREKTAAELTKGGADAVPVLIYLQLEEGTSSGVAGGILRSLGEEAIPAFLTALKDEDKKIRLLAVRQLRRFEKAAPATFPGLIEALRDEDEDVRKAVAQTLGVFCCHKEANALVPALIGALDDRCIDVRFPAACALAYVKPPRAAGMKVLVQALERGGALARSAAASALGRIRQPDSIPFLERACTDEEHHVRREAAQALGGFGPGAKAVVPVLLKAMKDDNAGVRHAAAGAVAKIAPEELISHLEDANPAVRFAAALAVSRIQPHLKAAVPALVKALDDPSADVRNVAVKVLTSIDPEAVKAKMR